MITFIKILFIDSRLKVMKYLSFKILFLENVMTLHNESKRNRNSNAVPLQK